MPDAWAAPSGGLAAMTERIALVMQGLLHFAVSGICCESTS